MANGSKGPGTVIRDQYLDQIAIRMPLAAITQLVDRDVVADAARDILKDTSAWLMEEHVVGDDSRHAHRCGEVGQLEQPELVVRPSAQRERHVGAVAEGLAQTPQTQRAVLVGFVWHEHRDQAFAIGDEVSPGEIALSVAGATSFPSGTATQSRVGGAISRIDENQVRIG